MYQRNATKYSLSLGFLALIGAFLYEIGAHMDKLKTDKLVIII